MRSELLLGLPKNEALELSQPFFLCVEFSVRFVNLVLLLADAFDLALKSLCLAVNFLLVVSVEGCPLLVLSESLVESRVDLLYLVGVDSDQAHLFSDLGLSLSFICFQLLLKVILVV
uniref:Uncharacterized protein n=1 Tax=Strombidium inclinatum TaxID=197538 RepID=A0A7S3IP95_9SPIT